MKSASSDGSAEDPNGDAPRPSSESALHLSLRRAQTKNRGINGLTKALPKLAEAATALDLKRAFETHLRETETHVSRAEQLFGLFGEQPDADGNDAVKGLVSAGADVAKVNGEDSVRDAALIAAAQEAEHYEIAAYGTLRTWAQILAKPEAVQLLEWTLEEEKKADQTLTQIACALNFKAAMTGARR